MCHCIIWLMCKYISASIFFCLYFILKDFIFTFSSLKHLVPWFFLLKIWWRTLSTFFAAICNTRDTRPLNIVLRPYWRSWPMNSVWWLNWRISCLNFSFPTSETFKSFRWSSNILIKNISDLLAESIHLRTGTIIPFPLIWIKVILFFFELIFTGI